MDSTDLNEFFQELDAYRQTQRLPLNPTDSIVDELKDECRTIRAERDYFQDLSFHYRKICEQYQQLLFYQHRRLKLSAKRVEIVAENIIALCFSEPIANFDWSIQVYNQDELFQEFSSDSLKSPEHTGNKKFPTLVSQSNFIFFSGATRIKLACFRTDLVGFVFYS